MSCLRGTQDVDHSYTIPITEPGNGNSSILRGTNGVKSLFTPSDSMKTCFDIFTKGKKANPNSNCLGARTVGADGKLGDYSWITYEQADKRARDLGAGILKLQLSLEVSF